METVEEVAYEMIRFGERHWMHDEGQNMRMFAKRILKALKEEKSTSTEGAPDAN